MWVNEEERHIYAINHLDIDPKIRRYANDYEDLDASHLICEIYLKGYQPVNNFKPASQFVEALKAIEEGKEPSLEVVKPMPLARYKEVEKIITLKEHGYRVGTNIYKKYIDEAYDLVSKGMEVPEGNMCHPYTYKKINGIENTATSQELVEFEKQALTEQQIENMSRVYTEFVVNRTPKAEIKRKFGLSYTTINKYVDEMRKFLTTRFVPQDEVADALEESKRNVKKFYELRDSMEDTLKTFDARTKDTYENFIKEYETKFGTPKVVVKGIAYERGRIIETLLKVNKALADERKSELELKGLINRPIDLLQLNIYNSMENPDEKMLKSALNPNKNVDERGPIIDVTPLDSVDDTKYIKYLSKEDQDKYYDLMDKLSDLAIKDADGELEEIGGESESFGNTFG